MMNKQTDDPTGWRWPFAMFGGERATRESELSRPLYHAAWVAALVLGAFVVILCEALLIGRGLPLSLGLAVLWWLGRPALIDGGLPFSLRLAVVVVLAALAGAWLFWLGPAILWRGWFPVWYAITPTAFIIHGNARGIAFPLWVLWLRLGVIVALPVVYLAAGGPVLLRFWQEILLPGLSAVRAFPVDVWRLPFPPFSWFSPADKAEPVETQTVIGPDLEPHTEPLTHTHTTMRSNGSGLSWRREVIALGLTDAQWTEIARRALGGLGWTDAERLPGIALHNWRKLRQALARVGWLENPTRQRYELTAYGREQLERIAAGDYSPLGR